MNRWTRAAIALLFIAAPVCGQTTQALDVVPDDALAFLLIKDLRQLSDNVDQLANKLKVPERVSLLELIHKEMGIRDGLREQGSALFVVLKGQKKEGWGFDPVVILPVSDHRRMFEQLGVKQPTDGINEGKMGIITWLL